MGSKKFKVITSWDDGHPLDLKLAEVLNKYHIPAIFFIPRKNPEREVMNEREIKELARNFEVGAHALNHVDLTTVTLRVAKEEIEGSKKWLENLLGRKVTKFCYPKGGHNSEIIKLVKEAGFTYARTVKCFEVHPEKFGSFEQPTTLKVGAWRKSFLKKIWREKYFLNPKTLAYWLKGLSWLELAKIYYNIAGRKNGVFHLWGHSWEIEKEKNWEVLESLFKKWRCQ